MKSAKVLYKIAYLLIVVLVAVFTVGYAFAWFFDRKEAEFSITGSSQGAYFESGDGSAEKPFVISNPTHMHNLAVLQNTGKLDTKYYYEIKKTITEIDMSGRYIPPIGNDEHPFIGDFNGNGKTLAGLQVTTNKDLLRSEYPNHARDIYEFSQAVGLFGMTGADSNIHNLILDNPTVDVSAATDTKYSATANAYAGIAVGFVAGKVSSVGVRAANAALNVNVTGYSSFNSILGELADGVTSSVTGGGAVSGGDTGYGVPTDLKELYEALGNKDGSTVEKRMAFPFKVQDSALVVPTEDELSVTLSAGSKQVETATTQVATSSNIGYYVGSDIKGYNKANVNYNEFYYPNNSSESYLLPYTNGNVSYPAPEQSVIEYLSKTGTYLLRMTGTTQVNVTNEDDLVVVPNGQVGTYSGNILLPRRCIWVAPIAAGKLRFVFMNVESSSMGARILKLTRSTPKNYGTYFLGREQILEFNNLMLKGKAYYIEIPVTQEDIDAGYEYAVTAGDGYKPYFAFIDLGANGANIHYGQVDLKNNVSAVDFIYNGVEIKQADETADLKIGDFIVNNSGTEALYEASKTSIYFTEYNNVLEIIYLRLYGRDDSKTINLVNYTSDTIKDSGVKATLTQYVLPTGIIGGSGGTSSGGGTNMPSISGAISVLVGSAPFKLTANNISGTLYWSSSDTNVATVDQNGNVTLASGAKAGDQFTITVTNGTASASRTITVTAATVAAESVTISGAPSSLAVGGSATLIATVKPDNATDKTITWTSSNENIVTVDNNGIVTAVGAGEVTVTATTEGGVSAGVKITVTASDTYTIVATNGFGDKNVFNTSNGNITPKDAGAANYISNISAKKGTSAASLASGKDLKMESSTVLSFTTSSTLPAGSKLIFTYASGKVQVSEPTGVTMTNDTTLTLSAGTTYKIVRNGTSTISSIKLVLGNGGTTPETHTHSYSWTVTTAPTASVTGQATGTCTSTTGTCTAKTVTKELPVLSATDYNITEDTAAGKKTYTLKSDTAISFDVINTYTVTFDSQSGSAVTAETVTHGGKATKPDDPTRTGYTFGGWFKEAACTNEYSFDTAVTGNLTLYAKWTAATVAVESVSLNKTTLSLTVGGSETLSATVSPSGATNKDVTWSSDKPSVATVDSNGKVTAVGEGTATITVTTADGGFTAQCTVTVNAAYTTVYDNDYRTGTVINGTATYPTAGGVYSYISGTPTSGSNSVTISGGKLVLADSSDVSTNAYVRLNNTYINTKVRIEGSVTQTDSGTSGNWSFLSLRDNDGNEIFALRTDSSDGKKIKVYKGTGFVSTASVAYSTNTPITFTIDIDLTNKKATVTVLDTVLGTDIEIDSNTFAGISMITAGASSRNATLDSFVAKVTDTASVVTPTTPTVRYVTITQGETASVAYGGSLKLDATVTMSDGTTNNNVTWSSGNTAVATVDSNGNITTKGVGTAVITATANADNTQSASTTVTVTGFTVSYVINGYGTQPANVTNVIKLPATLPTLTETGYTFDGWFTDSALTKAATAGAAISGNTTLYAKWTESGGGETVTGEISLPSNNSGALNINDGANPPVITVSSSNTWTSGKVPDGSGQVDAIYTSTNNQSVTVKSTKRATVTLVVGASNSTHNQTENGTFTFTSNDNTHTINNVSVAKPSSNSYVVQATVTLNLAENEEITITCDKRFVLFSISYEYNQ